MKDMTKEQSEKLRQLILNEIAFRKEFREKRKALEDLVFPITEHVDECCRFWKNVMDDPDEVVVIMDDNTTFKLTKPKNEVCSVQSYLPFGMEYQECKVVSIG